MGFRPGFYLKANGMETTPEKQFVERRAHDKFRLLFEHSSDAHFIMINEKITDCNEAAVNLLRCSSREEVLAIRHLSELSPEYQPDGTRSLEKSAEMDALARKNGYHRFEWYHRKTNGEVFPVEVTLNAIEINSKPALIAVWHDLTERNRREEELRSAHRKLKEDLQAAAVIQQSLLPLKSPFISGIRTGWKFRPSDELGGDSLNVFMLDEKNVGFYVLDAAGHGVAASLLAVSVAHFLSPFSEASLLKSGGKISSPSQVARQLNQHFCSNPEATQLFTLIYGILNRDTLEFSYVSAGHLPPALLRGGQPSYLEAASGPPIGAWDGADYQDTVVSMKAGDRLYFYSDGLIEAKNRTGELYGMEKFLELLASQCGTALSETAEKIVRKIEAWCEPLMPSDDISLLAFDLLGAKGCAPGYEPREENKV